MSQKSELGPNPTLVPGTPQLPSPFDGPDKISDSKSLVVPKTLFTKEMCRRAVEAGIKAEDMLRTIAYDHSYKFRDYKLEFNPQKRCRELVEFERHASLPEIMECLKILVPYETPKKVDVAHSGQVTVLHTLAQSTLDAVTIDDQGNVIEAEFDEVDEDLNE